MKLRLTLSVLLITAGLSFATSTIHIRWISPPRPFPAPVEGIEQYGTGTSGAGPTTLLWHTFMHGDVPRPFVLVMHVGLFKLGSPGPGAVCTDLYYEGYNCAAIQYRLADPGTPMRPPDGDQPLGDHGNYPEQVEDFSAAIIAARTGSTPNTTGQVTGEVIGIGGSAGGTHVAYMAADVLNGGDKLDLGVMLSGAYDFHDPSSLAGTCATSFGDAVRNYVNCTAGDPACDDDGGALDLASAYRRFTATSSKVQFFSTDIDSMPVNQYNAFVIYLTFVGAPFESRLITDPPFNPLGCSRHAFQYWYPIAPDWPDSVNAEVITFIESNIPPP